MLKCCHHGSSTATSDEFLCGRNPTAGSYHSRKENRYGHPDSEVLDKLENDDVKDLPDLRGKFITAVKAMEPDQLEMAEIVGVLEKLMLRVLARNSVNRRLNTKSINLRI